MLLSPKWQYVFFASFLLFLKKFCNLLHARIQFVVCESSCFDHHKVYLCEVLFHNIWLRVEALLMWFFLRTFDWELKLCLCEVSSKAIISKGIYVLLSSRRCDWCSVFVKFVWKHSKFESSQFEGSFYVFVVKVLQSYWEHVHFYHQNYMIKTLLESNHLGRSLGDFVVMALWSKLCWCEVSLRAFKASIILEGVCAFFS